MKKIRKPSSWNIPSGPPGSLCMISQTVHRNRQFDRRRSVIFFPWFRHLPTDSLPKFRHYTVNIPGVPIYADYTPFIYSGVICVYFLFFGLFWLHNGFTEEISRGKNSPTCNDMTHAVLPIRKSDAADISMCNVVLMLLSAIPFPPSGVPEDAAPLSGRGRQRFNGNFSRKFADIRVGKVFFLQKRPDIL